MDQTAKRDAGKLTGEYSAEFDRLRQARVNVSFYKYGPARKNFGEGRVDALATAKRCLDAFEKDHNLEHLLMPCITRVCQCRCVQITALPVAAP